MGNTANLQPSAAPAGGRGTALALGALGVVTVVSRLPFLSPGFGLDPDAWRIAASARHLAETGGYTVSRFPGYPIPEATLSLLVGSGAWAMNLVTALLSVAAVLLTAMIALRLGIRAWFWIGLALAFVPVVYIHSVDTMDYVWALAFVLAATYLTLRRWPIAAGIALGLAIGCRLTSAVLIIPLAILELEDRKHVSTLMKLAIATVVTAIVAFLPVLFTYGFGFLTFYSAEYPSMVKVVKGMTVGLLGRTGLWTVTIALVGALIWKRWRSGDGADGIRWTRFRLAAFAAIALWVLMYLCLPHDPAYLIPAIPFALILLGQWLNPKVAAVASIVIVLGSFGQVCNSGVICRAGILDNHEARERNARKVETVIARARATEKPSTIVIGWWLPQVEASVGANSDKSVEFVYLLDSTELARLGSEGRNLYYLDEIAGFNRARMKVDLAGAGGRALDLSK